VESLQNFIIGKKYNSNEITPNLNKLAKGGIYFNNIYDQTASGNSSDATLLANTSLYPSQRGAASFLYAQNCFDSLPKVLKEHGYTSAILYPYVSSFWNSATFDKAIGFEHQFYQNDFVMEENIGLGLSDRAFLSQSLEKIRRLSTPFYVSLRTLTNHFPYYYVTKDIDSFPIGAMEGKTIGYYMRSTHYVDSAIGEFLQKLSENDLRSNTIIVIYGDHRARLTEDDLKSIGVYDISETHKIPVIISLANRRQGETRDTIGGLIDIAPTICNILGIDISDRFFMGRDLGYGDNSFAIFRDGSYICEDESMNKLTAQQQLMISDSILEKDIVRLLSDKQRCLMP
jgi:phosphoglycerol transferase MdoB-like AlkP superfamily enzyme